MDKSFITVPFKQEQFSKSAHARMNIKVEYMNVNQQHWTYLPTIVSLTNYVDSSRWQTLLGNFDS